MILSVEKAKSLISFPEWSDEKIEMKLKAIEQTIRAYTNNNFQNREDRITACIRAGVLMSDSLIPFGIGDTVQISESRFNTERLDAVNSRLDLIYTLQRKHRCEGIEELIALRDRYNEQLSTIEHSDELLAEAEQRVAECEKATTSLAVKLHDARLKASPTFAKGVVEILRNVAMADAEFKIAVTPCTPTASGADTVDFLFSANASVEPRPIEKIASGGELSRVMLALKTILAQHLALPTIIFDEIDTGISGRTANDVGDIIAQLAKSMQVIDITHSPQVASKGSRHFLVYKEQSRSNIRPLSQEERVEEIAKMLSGDTITEAALAQARHLLSL